MNGKIDTQRKIGVVIPTYKRADSLIRCIESLRAGCTTAFDVVVVNDCGDPDTTSKLRQLHPDCIELVSTRDLWWTKAVNEGLSYLITREYSAAILLNDDVTVAPGFVEAISRAHCQAPSAIIVSKILDEFGKVWALGGYVSWPFKGERHITSLQQSRDRKNEIRWSPGMGTLIPLEAIAKIGLLDDHNLPQYLSDVDFGLRATRAGLQMVLNEQCVVRNNTQTTGGLGAKRRPKLSDFYFLLSNRRSADYLKARAVLIYRHAPFGLRTISLAIRLGKVAFHCAKRAWTC
jgi:GT2 family glycosyltransferase